MDFFSTVSIVTTGSTGSVLESNLGLTITHKVRRASRVCMFTRKFYVSVSCRRVPTFIP